MWQCVLNFLESLAPVISLATLILVAVYVLYTIKTFRSIHLQTELQSQAYLLVSYDIAQAGLVGISGTSGAIAYSGPSSKNYRLFLGTSSGSVGSISYPERHERIEQKMAELYNRWHIILSQNISQALQPENDIILHLQNRGRSDIIWWKIDLKAHIESGKHLSKINIKGEDCAWSIESKGSNEVIAPMDGIGIVIGKSGVFPEITLSWTIEYKDMRDDSYTRFGGDRSLTDRNVLADPAS